MNDRDAELRCWTALAIAAGTAPRRAWVEAVRRLGGPRETFRRSAAELAAAGIDANGARRILEFNDWARVRRALDTCRRIGIDLVAAGDAEYPALLAEIADPPLLLYRRGRPELLRAPAVAVVGSRRATAYGLRTAERLAAGLSERGVAVTSGLAYGIDAAAHRGALDRGATGGTIAVLAAGLDRPYPRGNLRLFERIAAEGCLLSEHPPGTEARPYLFPVRNRIVTGLSRCTVIVEATLQSGTLGSARHALDQGREVFAVPGPIDAPTSAGPNALIRDGAPPMLDAADVLEAVGVTREPAETSVGRPEAPGVGDPDARRVLAAVGEAPRPVDAIIEGSSLDGARVMELLTRLELAGAIASAPGGMYMLAR